MKKTPAQKSELKLRYVFAVIVLLILSAVYCFSKPRVLFYDEVTKTKYLDGKRFSQAVFSNGEVLAYGNEKTEYENNEIGE